MEFDLSPIGLNKYESLTYATLIKLGKSTATKISQTSGVPQGKIYGVLDSLARKGLIDIIPKEPKEFILNDPQNLMEIVNRSKENIEKIKLKVEEMKKSYEANKQTDDSKVVVRQGKEAFYNIVEKLKNPEKYDYTIHWTYEFNKEWAKRDKVQLKKGIDIKSLTRYDNETKSNVKKWLKIHKNIKKIENEGVALAIQDDYEVMIAIIGCNSIFLIRDHAFAKLMKNMFLNIYNRADSIK